MELGKKRRSYDSEFKREAVKLVLEGGRVASEVAKGLGIC
jgi:transposase-like protein